MTRDIDSVDPRDRDQVRTQPDPPPRSPEQTPTLSRERQSIAERGYVYQISEAERATLYEVGRFRTVATEDLARYRYRGNQDQLSQDVRSLASQGLIQRRTIWTGTKGKHLSIVVLTKRGKEVLERNTSGSGGQSVYSGFVKPAEVQHDAAIYRMYHAEAQKIENSGGRIGRVVLDYELKRNVHKALAKTRSLPRSEKTRHQAETARQTGLKVVNGKILLPDLRIEYETQDGELTHVDLELATPHYRGSQMRGKAEAGFKIYAAQESASRLTAAFDPELIAPIFAF